MAFALILALALALDQILDRGQSPCLAHDQILYRGQSYFALVLADPAPVSVVSLRRLHPTNSQPEVARKTRLSAGSCTRLAAR